MRVSIRKHHDQYLTNLAAQMGVDPTEALNYALFELKRQGFSFSSPLSTVTPVPQPPQPIGAFVRYEELAPTLPTTAPTTAPTPDQEPDEVIAKFLALGMEEF